MSIYVDPEEYYAEKLSEETEKYLRSIIMAVAWFQEDIVEMEVSSENCEESQFNFRINWKQEDQSDEGDW